MNFASDNTAGISPEILAAIADANEGAAASYGADPITARLEAKLAEIFEHEVAVFPVATGTAANALALAAVTPPWGAVLCHPLAHITCDEANAPEFYTGGAKLVSVPGADGKLVADDLAALLPGDLGNVHHAQPAAVSLTQATECGTVYRPAEIAAIADVAHRHGLAVHMDGARFANAMVHLDASPAELTWRAGVDVLSLGATKNGALGAEAIVFFDVQRGRELAFRRKRAGHLFSKMRFLSAQLDAYVTNDLWRRNARHANAAATQLAGGLSVLPGVSLRHPVEANELFVEMPEAMIVGLFAAGGQFYRWQGAASTCVRLVTAWNTAASDVATFVDAASRLAAH
ncbi:MAG TPA: low specificity L-threonine aldolase [Aliidongia sp.]|uniref:threonine aldolase family protein n=1 Tax=Aliidongia sp. TaxID=1914230 RepID=UPI002DDCB62C|nr:low specificity L-threonine aldolase [Aliidongia sp.]HEV2676652.1 low specificity L-threonine aldolase [Aliidongia sp.]